MTWLLPALVALVPLIITPGILFYFDVTPKLIALLIGTAIAVPFLFPWVQAKGLSRWLYILAAAQALSVTLSTVFSQRLALSIAGSNWRTLGLLSQSVLLLFTLVTFAWIAGRPERMNLLLRWISGAGSLAALYGIAQYFGWDPWLPAKAYQAGEGIFTIVRPPGTVGHADYFANYLLFVAFAGFALAMNEGGTARRLGGCAAFLAGFAMVLTGTRGALAGAAAGALYLLIRLRPRMSWRALAACLALVVAGSAFYFSPLGFRLRSRVHWIGEDVRGGGRLLLWRDSLRFASQHWVVGAGPETFSALFPQYQSPDLARAYPDFYYESPHNLFLDALTSQGVLGVAILAAWIGLGISAGNARGGYSPYLAATLVAGVAAHFFAVFILPTAMYFYLTVAMLVGMRSEAVATGRRWVLAPLSAAMIFLALRMLAADRSLEVTRRDLEAGRTMDAIEHYRVGRAGGLSADVWFARSLGILASQEAMDAAGRATGGEDAQNAYYTVAWLYARSGDVPRTEQSLRASIACSPNWFKPHWMLAQVLLREGRLEESRREAERAAYLNAGKNPEVGSSLPGR